MIFVPKRVFMDVSDAQFCHFDRFSTLSPLGNINFRVVKRLSWYMSGPWGGLWLPKNSFFLTEKGLDIYQNH